MTRDEHDPISRTDPDAPLTLTPKIIPGPLVRATLSDVRMPLANLSGLAIERITRERTETPPGFELPERPVYFLDPATRRMIMISNRYHNEPSKSGLFAEIVELDEKGEPKFTLTSSKIDFSYTSYQVVAVGPNKFKMPPSHLEVDENGDRTVVSWNFWLGNIQNWLNETQIGQDEKLDTFLDRFEKSISDAQLEAAKKVKEAFPVGEQGIDSRTAPVNMIITDEDRNGKLARASREAGLFPLVFHPKRLANRYDELLKGRPDVHDIRLYTEKGRFLPSVISCHNEAVVRFLKGIDYTRGSGALTHMYERFQRENPIFATVQIWAGGRKPWKAENGAYEVGTGKGIEHYRGLLTKLKADLYLTMLARGKAAVTR